MSIVAPLVVALAVVIVMLLPKQTTVPNLKGQPSAFAAQKLLNKVDLKLGKTTTQVDPKDKAGSILNQIPAPGSKAKKGGLVTIIVATGTGKTAVPELVGLPLGVADQKLIGAQLTLGTIQPQPPNPAGKVLSQLPLAGTMVPTGSAVNVFQPTPAATGTSKKAKTAIAAAATALGVGAGAAAAAAASTGNAGPRNLTPVQAQAGLGSIAIPQVPTDQTQAGQVLANLGLVPQAVKQRSTAPVGQVAGTVPAAGAKVPKGAHVALLVSSGPPELAFDNGTQINIIDPTTGKASAQIPPGIGGQVDPAWSHDGQHLVYAQSGVVTLVEPGVATSPPSPITKPPPGMTDRNPSLAPTDKMILAAYLQGVGDHAHELCFVMVLKFTPRSTSCKPVPAWNLGGQVSWSPDGQTILVLGTRNNGATFGLLAFSTGTAFSPQASNWEGPDLMTDDSVPGRGVYAGTVSPNGKQLALVAGSTNNGFNLYINNNPRDFTTSDKTPLPVTACQISWRSDSQALAVMQPNGPCGAPQATGKIVGVNPAGPRNLITLAAPGAHPAWQPVPGS